MATIWPQLLRRTTSPQSRQGHPVEAGRTLTICLTCSSLQPLPSLTHNKQELIEKQSLSPYETENMSVNKMPITARYKFTKQGSFPWRCDKPQLLSRCHDR